MLTSKFQTNPHQPLTYAALQDRTAKALAGFMLGERPGLDGEVERFRDVMPRDPDWDGDVEVLDGVTFIHRFVQTPRDKGLVTHHVVVAGPADGEVVRLLHGIPDSWYQWCRVMARLAGRFRLIAPDIKGYGQSDKRPADYTYPGPAAKFVGVLDALSVDRFNLVTHERGTVPGGHIAAEDPFRVARYARGEQHLANYHPMLSPQEHVFAPRNRCGIRSYSSWRYWAAPSRAPSRTRSSSARSRNTAISASPRPCRATSTARPSPRSGLNGVRSSCGTGARQCCCCGAPTATPSPSSSTRTPLYIPNVPSVEVTLIDAGHFWPVENPDETGAAIEKFLTATPPFDPANWRQTLKTARP